MSLETILVIIMICPFIIGVLAALFFDGDRAVTPIIIYNHLPSQPQKAISNDEIESEEEFLNQDAPTSIVNSETKLEESHDALEKIQAIEHEEAEFVSKPQEYVSTEIPEAVNRSLQKLFSVIEGTNDEKPTPVGEKQLSSEGSQPPIKVVPTPLMDIPEELAPGFSNFEEFESVMPSVDEMLEQMSNSSQTESAKIYNFPYGENLPLPPREYWALQQKYGAEVVSKVTTTPGVGGTGEYDCMIGRVVRKNNLLLLQYSDHYIPLKGMVNLEGVFLVEGMFIKPDLFFVNNYTNLAENANTLDRAAEI